MLPLVFVLSALCLLVASDEPAAPGMDCPEPVAP
jgi:hypothetical protein